MSNVSPKVFVVDDDASFLKAVSRLLRASGFEVETYSSASDLLSAINNDQHGCIVTDLQMPDVNGLGLQAALKAANIALPLVFLTAFGDIPTSVHAMRNGAEDFLCKSTSKQQLIDAIKRAIERDTKQRTERARLEDLRAPFKLLTPREQEVLGQVLLGKPNKAIAAMLAIDERSVKRHRTNLMNKLKVDSVAELTHLVHETGIYDAEHSASSNSAAHPQNRSVPKGTLFDNLQLK